MIHIIRLKREVEGKGFLDAGTSSENIKEGKKEKNVLGWVDVLNYLKMSATQLSFPSATSSGLYYLHLLRWTIFCTWLMTTGLSIFILFALQHKIERLNTIIVPIQNRHSCLFITNKVISVMVRDNALSILMYAQIWTGDGYSASFIALVDHQRIEFIVEPYQRKDNRHHLILVRPEKWCFVVRDIGIQSLIPRHAILWYQGTKDSWFVDELVPILSHQFLSCNIVTWALCILIIHTNEHHYLWQ